MSRLNFNYKTVKLGDRNIIKYDKTAKDMSKLLSDINNKKLR